MKARVWLSGLVVGLAVIGFSSSAAIAQTDDPLQNPLLQEAGMLEEGDAVLSSDGSLYDEYTFEGQAGQSITITLQSEQFDTYLALLDPEQKVIGENDDIAQENDDSELTVTLPSNGTYTVIANGFDSTSRGEYMLEVKITEGDLDEVAPDTEVEETEVEESEEEPATDVAPVSPPSEPAPQ
jgi:hypothetical protein